MGNEKRLPRDEEEKKAAQERLRNAFRNRFARIADSGRDKLIELYGEEAGKQVRYAEAFEICEYGRQPSSDEIRKLFPFFPESKSNSSD